MTALSAISLFSGAGGMDVGFKRAGFQILAANELDSYACRTYRANHPESHLLEGDIGSHLATLGDYRGVDVLFGGPPCQGFSVAGKMDLNDPRSQLIFAFADVVHLVQPKIFVLENVKSLAMLDKFSAIRTALVRRFNQLGYAISMNVLNAKDYGAAQSRERVFFIGTRNTVHRVSLSDLARHKRKTPSLRQAIQHLGTAGSASNPRVCNAKITLAAKPILRKSPYAGMLFNGQGRPWLTDKTPRRLLSC